MLGLNLILSISTFVQMDFFTLGTSEATINAYINNEYLSWEEATEKCQMVGLNNRVLLQVGSTGAAWINATADYTAWAEYKGCFVYNDTSVLETNEMNSSNPFLRCLEECQNHTYFGLQNSECSCIKDDSFRYRYMKHLCSSKPCDHDKYALCSDEKDGFVIYKTEQSMEFQEGVGNCLTSLIRDRNKQSYIPERCSEQLPFICQRSHNREDIGKYPEGKNTWINGCNTCLHPAIPASVNVIEHTNVPTGRFWTGAIRRFWEIHPPVYNSTFCLSAHVTTDGHVVRSVRDCNDRLPILCVGNTHNETEVGVVVVALSTGLGVALVLVCCCLRLKRRSISTKHQSKIETGIRGKPNTNTGCDKGTLRNNQSTSCYANDHMNHTCEENYYETIDESVHDYANAPRKTVFIEVDNAGYIMPTVRGIEHHYMNTQTCR